MNKSQRLVLDTLRNRTNTATRTGLSTWTLSSVTGLREASVRRTIGELRNRFGVVIDHSNYRGYSVSK